MVEQHGRWAGPSRFQAQVDAVLDEITGEWGHSRVYTDADSPEQQERKANAFTADVAVRLRQRGLCATTKVETPGGGSGDEVGVKDGLANEVGQGLAVGLGQRAVYYIGRG